jgi:hypothetical protein
MMNTLANHGFLPHDGSNITLENAVHALTSALNFNESLATLMWQQAIFINPKPNATFFTLDQLNVHNVLEHDASLSRSDAAFGNNHVFNQTVFDTTKRFFTSDTLDRFQLANAKMFRQLESKAFNDNYTFTSTMEQFSLGEVGAPITVFGDFTTATVNRTFVEYFFENERLPSELGWVKKEVAPVVTDVLRISGILANASALITGATVGSSVLQEALRRDLHSGFSGL